MLTKAENPRMFDCLIKVGGDNIQKGDALYAYTISQEALKNATRATDMALAHQLAGVSSRMNGDIPAAYSNLKRALEYAELADDSMLQAAIQRDYGAVLQTLYLVFRSIDRTAGSETLLRANQYLAEAEEAYSESLDLLYDVIESEEIAGNGTLQHRAVANLHLVIEALQLLLSIESLQLSGSDTKAAVAPNRAELTFIDIDNRAVNTELRVSRNVGSMSIESFEVHAADNIILAICALPFRIRAAHYARLMKMTARRSISRRSRLAAIAALSGDRLYRWVMLRKLGNLKYWKEHAE